MNYFTESYIESLLWTESGDVGLPLGQGANITEISPELMTTIEQDCADFQAKYEQHFDGNPVQAGHDFALTRNGHGAGFWDGDWPEPAATILTDASKEAGQIDLYRGDDGLIYAM